VHLHMDMIGIADCGSDFPPQVIRWSILTTSENENGKVHVNKTHHKKERH